MSRVLSPKAIPGLIIAVLGVALLLHNFDVIELGDVTRWWPMLMVALGVQWAVDGRNKVFGALVVVAGGALQLDKLDLITVEWRELWQFWPALLIAVGLGMVLQKGGRENLFGGVFVASLGAYFLASNLGMIRFEVWELWPLAVILLGIGMIRKAMR